MILSWYYSKTGCDGMYGHVLRKEDTDWVKKCMNEVGGWLQTKS